MPETYDIHDEWTRSLLPPEVVAHADHLDLDVWSPTCRWCNPTGVTA